jgi:hypothetical protein
MAKKKAASSLHQAFHMQRNLFKGRLIRTKNYLEANLLNNDLPMTTLERDWVSITRSNISLILSHFDNATESLEKGKRNG